MNKPAAVRRTPEEVCRSKARYRSKSVAREFGQAVTRRFNRPMWVYQCPVCGDWHLTSSKMAAPSAAVNYERKR